MLNSLMLVEINECANNQCPPNATQCVDQINGYTCQRCPMGFTGEDCTAGMQLFLYIKLTLHA